ncbi:IS21-like element helper ATPase IstB [Flavobacterium sp. YJ01]|uniref:IS21-like element helper ATPase IstB n=1 Tax=unclassified Flavobacterium TaxID=196869 RepID=UPI0021178189|nr:IS21-like element helper ATPase IstB [Flavobacterium sp. YJ01]WET02936.1 IS21-like element helper ATPase IstB [Flavobacterium sp. YJ01]
MTAIESGKTDHYTLDQFISMIIDAEWDERHNRRIERSIANARFHYKSNIESINFDQSRNIDRNLILRLAECSFVEKNENILITGSTGVGKSFLGPALGYQACIEGYKVSYFNSAKLFAKLKMAKADGTYLRELTKIQRQDVIILDDFGLQSLDSHNRIALLEIIEDRHNNGSIIVTSQIPVQGWYDIIGEKTIADAILDRLIHQSHRVELHGESMRKKKSINKG